MRSGDQVHRPNKTTEYLSKFDSSGAAKGWRDLYATHRNTLVEAWDYLTKSPLEKSEYAYPLMTDLAITFRNWKPYERWQLKLSARSGARIWYFVSEQTVFIECVFTAHPNQTK